MKASKQSNISEKFNLLRFIVSVVMGVVMGISGFYVVEVRLIIPQKLDYLLELLSMRYRGFVH